MQGKLDLEISPPFSVSFLVWTLLNNKTQTQKNDLTPSAFIAHRRKGHSKHSQPSVDWNSANTFLSSLEALGS